MTLKKDFNCLSIITTYARKLAYKKTHKRYPLATLNNHETTLIIIQLI